jgi:hypothetical protein
LWLWLLIAPPAFVWADSRPDPKYLPPVLVNRWHELSAFRLEMLGEPARTAVLVVIVALATIAGLELVGALWTLMAFGHL